eukprot:155842-Rhodomonas_salina.1
MSLPNLQVEALRYQSCSVARETWNWSYAPFSFIANLINNSSVVGAVHAPAQAHDRRQVAGEGRLHSRNAKIGPKGVPASDLRADQRLPDWRGHTQRLQLSAGNPALEEGAQGGPPEPQTSVPDARGHENGNH